MPAVSSAAAPVIALLALPAGRSTAVIAQGGSTDTLHLSLAEVLTQVRGEHLIWKAGSAKVLAARVRALLRRLSGSLVMEEP